MTDSEVTELLEKIRTKIKNEGLSANYLSRKADISYNTVKNFLSGTTEPDFRTVIRLADAAGFTVNEIFSGKNIIIEVNGEDNQYIRRYKRLDAYYQKMVRTEIDALTLMQERNDKREGRWSLKEPVLDS